MITLSVGKHEKVRRLVFETPVYKVMVVQEGSVATEPYIRSPEDVARVVAQHLRGVDREHFVGLYLNAANRLIGIHTLTIGTLTASLVHPREVFKPAIRESACAMILVHNHPNGDPTPSQDDKNITRELKKAAEILGIRILDHIVMAKDKILSMVEERIL